MNVKTRLPAELFKLAIDSGHYDYWSGMCIALGGLEIDGVITRTERRLAIKEIDRYMANLMVSANYLREALEWSGLPHDEEATTALYLDWDNRPYKDEA